MAGFRSRRQRWGWGGWFWLDRRRRRVRRTERRRWRDKRCFLQHRGWIRGLPTRPNRWWWRRRGGGVASRGKWCVRTSGVVLLVRTCVGSRRRADTRRCRPSHRVVPSPTSDEVDAALKQSTHLAVSTSHHKQLITSQQQDGIERIAWRYRL